MQWSGKGWTVTLTDSEVSLADASRRIAVPRTAAARLELGRRWFRWTLSINGQTDLRLLGLRRSEALKLKRALQLYALAPAIEDALAWRASFNVLLDQGVADQRWISAESIDVLVNERPPSEFLARVRNAGFEGSLTEEQTEAVRLLDLDVRAVVAETNKGIMAAELDRRRSFFETIEKSPLTEEQARAVVCFDNRVQVLAAAGSGKTSVMVARAAYAVSRGFVAPDRILLLAFNKSAAAELQQRVEERFEAARIDSSGVRASTFHSFGLDVIGQATGEKPRLAPWLEQGKELEMIQRIVDELRDGSESFRYNWDLYRLLFANAPTSIGEDEPDGYDKRTKRTGYRTFAGEVVKSHGERLVADFLYLNGVNYEYDKSYPFQVSDATHSQYRPDFYYPEIDVWHEHWALDRDGRPPASFKDYAAGLEWKRRIHAQHKTILIETTWADIVFGDGLAQLTDKLIRRGLTFDWNPDRRPKSEWVRPMKHEELGRLVRTFMAHVKSNSWTAQDLERRLGSDLRHLDGYRTRLFLELYWPIHSEWERRLTADGSIDFEDMLVRAADHLEAGEVDSGYELVMVDEFQDASQARARLVRGLINKPGRFLLAVGDDWQAINRFAGADLSVMTDFASWFGQGQQLALTTTFRCPQTICDVARVFVSKNPTQFNKPMRSSRYDPGDPIRVVRSEDAARALKTYLDEVSALVANGTVPVGPSGKVSVDVLGRYAFERSVLPLRYPSNLQVTFRTIHSAKGLEADFVVVPGLATGTYGFPSNVADDPVLDLAMPKPELFPHAEERRLFYVALTRARLGATLIASPTRMSPFVVELLDHPLVTVTGTSGEPVQVCPGCGQGTVVRRSGRYGPFLGCSTFPQCRYTRAIPQARPSPLSS